MTNSNYSSAKVDTNSSFFCDRFQPVYDNFRHLK